MANDSNRVVVELIAKTEQLDTKVRASAGEFERGMHTIELSADRAEGAITHAAGNSSTALAVLQGSVRHSVDQFAAGAPLTTIFAEHIEGLAEAGALAGGALGKFGEFLAGPWGIALSAGISLLTTFIAAEYGASDASEHHAKAAKSLQEALDDMNEALGKSIQSEQQAEVASLNAAAQKEREAVATRNLTAKLIDQARAQYEVDKAISAGPGQRGELGTLAAGESGNRLSALDALQARNDKAVASGQQAVRLASIPVLQRQVAEATDKATAATEAFTHAQDKLNERRKAGTVSASEYRGELAGLIATRDAALEAAKAHDKNTRAHQHHARAVKEDTSALRELEAAQKALVTAFNTLQDEYDPAAAAARRYRVELQEIADLQKKSAANPNPIDAATAGTFREGAADRLLKARAKAFSLPDVEEYRGQDKAYQESLKDAADQQRRLEDELQQHREDNVRSLAGLYEDLFTGGTSRIFDDFKKIGLKVIAEVLARMTLSHFDGQPGGSSLGSTLASVVGSIFSGGRASGGPVEAGRLYQVNEGASSGQVEGFRPAGSGTIIPLGSMATARAGGGTMIVQNITVDGRNSVTPEGFAQQIVAIANDHANRVAAQSGLAAVDASPGRIQQRNTLGT